MTNPKNNRPVRTAGTPHKRPTVTAASADRKADAASKKADDASTRIDTLDKRYESDIKSVTERLGGHDRSIKLITERDKRIDRLMSDLGLRLGEDHDTIVADVIPRIAKLEELVDDGMQLNLVAAITGFSTEQVKEILAIQAEHDLDTSALVTGMVDSIARLQRQFGAMGEHVATLTTRVDNHDERLDAIDGPDGQLNTLRDRYLTDMHGVIDRVERSETSVWKKITDDIRISNRPTIIGAILAAVTFVVVWLVTWLVGHHLTGNVYGLGDAKHTKVGTFGVNLHYGWIGFFLGLIAGFMVLFATSRTRVKFVHKEETKDKAKKSQQDDGEDVGVDIVKPSNSSSQDDNPTQQLPRVHSDNRQPVTS